MEVAAWIFKATPVVGIIYAVKLREKGQSYDEDIGNHW
jgi:hypothetical protein